MACSGHSVPSSWDRALSLVPGLGVALSPVHMLGPCLPLRFALAEESADGPGLASDCFWILLFSVFGRSH